MNLHGHIFMVEEEETAGVEEDHPLTNLQGRHTTLLTQLYSIGAHRKHQLIAVLTRVSYCP